MGSLAAKPPLGTDYGALDAMHVGRQAGSSVATGALGIAGLRYVHLARWGLGRYTSGRERCGFANVMSSKRNRADDATSVKGCDSRNEIVSARMKHGCFKRKVLFDR